LAKRCNDHLAVIRKTFDERGTLTQDQCSKLDNAQIALTDLLGSRNPQLPGWPMAPTHSGGEAQTDLERLNNRLAMQFDNARCAITRFTDWVNSAHPEFSGPKTVTSAAPVPENAGACDTPVVTATPKVVAIVSTAEVSQTTPTRRGKGVNIGALEANVKAREYLKDHPNATLRELKEHIGCSEGLVAKLPVWKATMERRKMARPIKEAKVVSLTPRMQEITGVGDALESLVAEQAEDHEPSPLENDPLPREEGAPRTVKVYRSGNRR
jgi:hypothetical protein